MPSVSLQTILQNNLPRGYTGSRGEPGAGYTGSKGSGLDDWIKISSNYTATSGNRLIADTSLASFTVTLPTSPQLGDHVVLTDGGDWSGYPLIIDSGAKQVEGYDEGVILDVGGVTTELLYDGTMWHVTATLGAEGPPGLGVPEGGTQGQILTKMSSTEYDTAWQDPAGGDLGSIEIVGSTIATTDSTDISIDRNLRVHGDLTPELDSVFDLGSADKKWRSLYVSGQSIYINNTAISVDESGNLLVGGQIVETGGGGGVNAITTFPTAINSDVTIAAGENALSVGPLTQATGTVITITAGQRWIIL